MEKKTSADGSNVAKPKLTKLGCTLAAHRRSSPPRVLRKCSERLARREGFEPPTLRFEESRKGKK